MEGVWVVYRPWAGNAPRVFRTEVEALRYFFRQHPNDPEQEWEIEFLAFTREDTLDSASSADS